MHILNVDSRCIRHGNLITAIDDYTHAIKLNPKYTNAYRNRGNVKYSLGKSKAEQGNITAAQQLYQDAIDDYTMSIKIEPKFSLPLLQARIDKAEIWTIQSSARRYHSRPAGFIKTQ